MLVSERAKTVHALDIAATVLSSYPLEDLIQSYFFIWWSSSNTYNDGNKSKFYSGKE
jgi:hypothetical protein